MYSITLLHTSIGIVNAKANIFMYMKWEVKLLFYDLVLVIQYVLRALQGRLRAPIGMLGSDAMEMRLSRGMNYWSFYGVTCANGNYFYFRLPHATSLADLN